MKNIRNIFLAFMLGIVSQSNAFDVCAGDFFEQYEKQFKEFTPYRESCKGYLNKNGQNIIKQIKNSDNLVIRRKALNLGLAAVYGTAMYEYREMLKVCSPNTQKLKARKAYFDIKVDDAVVKTIVNCEVLCNDRFYYDETDQKFCNM